MGLLVSQLDDLFNEDSNKFLYKSRIIDGDGIKRRKLIQADLLLRKESSKTTYHSLIQLLLLKTRQKHMMTNI